MSRLIIKELRLALHPTAPIFLLLSSMLMIPSYPYLVVFFYTGLAVFFTCLTGRENHDIDYSMLLPVAKRDIVRARILLVSLLEMAQLLLAVPFAVLRQSLIATPNAAGMDANIALFGLALIEMGLFNWVFFRSYYRDVQKVGTSFIKSSVAIFVYIAVMEAMTYILPLMRDVLDTPDPDHLVAKLLTLLLGVALYALLTWRTCRASERSFERQDL